jgi:transcriptional regulator with XRE-family HTH domain
MDTFGTWIKKKRLDGGWKAGECAARAGMTAQSWSDWENDRSRRKGTGASTPTLPTLEKIARGLEVELVEVLHAAGASVDLQQLVKADAAMREGLAALNQPIMRRSEDGAGKTEAFLVAFGTRIRTQRERLGLTQGDLANKIGIDQATISQYESGAIDVPVSRLCTVAGALFVRPEHLIAEEPPEEPELSAEEMMAARVLGSATFRQVLSEAITIAVKSVLAGSYLDPSSDQADSDDTHNVTRLRRQEKLAFLPPKIASVTEARIAALEEKRRLQEGTDAEFMPSEQPAEAIEATLIARLQQRFSLFIRMSSMLYGKSLRIGRLR